MKDERVRVGKRAFNGKENVLHFAMFPTGIVEREERQCK